MSEAQSKLITKAKLAEQAERFDDMTACMKEVVELSSEPLSAEDRNLLSVAYKNAVGSKRASWRSLNSHTQKADEASQKHQIAQEYKARIKTELVEKCAEVLELIKNCKARVRPEDHEQLVFFVKMQGDYYRYVAEVGGEIAGADPTELSQQSYESAMEIARAHLQPTHPVRLGLALNYSVFFFEIRNNSEKACEIARKVFFNIT